ncbi:MAG: fatty acid desaturase [Gemmatimonadales bacterium]|jgi:omega-6 fatty acid desaturase (delta-12 desaturase)
MPDARTGARPVPGAAGSTTPMDAKTLGALLSRYRSPSVHRSTVQLLVTAVPFFALWAAAYLALGVSYWLTLLLAIPAALFLIRLFMIQHDCGHGAFFPSRRANDWVGSALGVLTLVPYGYWRKTHAIHHKTSGDLDFRGFGDIDTLTVDEYRALSVLGRVRYRVYRNPIVMLVIGPAYQFWLKHRLPLDIPWSWKREWRSVHLTNLALLAIVLLAWATIGLGPFLLVQAPISLIAGAIGVYLFYVQHQFEDTYWREHPEWDFHAAGLQGSSFLVLPKVLQWFSANIGFHHIHHVSSRIPYYRLPECYDENPVFQHVTKLTLWQTMACLRLALWDERALKLVGFREAAAR